MSRNNGETAVFRRLRLSAKLNIAERMVFIMSYDVFCERVADIVKHTGSKVRFSREDGKHIAKCSDGVTIIGNTESHRVFVRWGSGHSALATI